MSTSSASGEGLTIGWRRGRLWLLLAGSVAFVIVAGLTAVVTARGDGGMSSLPFAFLCLGALVFAGFGLLIARQLVDRRPALILLEDAILAPTLAEEPIPLAALRGLRLVSYKGQPMIELTLDPAAEERLTLTRTVRWTRAANRKLGFPGLSLAAANFDRPPEEVAQLIVAAAQRTQAVSESTPPETTI